ncbi:hypothetical protein EWM64_g1440 [Hericium alpestre]|uniref:Uncharacterized protein n=1 Tax=Hericium alpestre TaxID=135208 RepID=A0A4Z0A8D2_9AGAM|nr:hypothetical protein EWM64_g1440 [Hericium alpestre]
MAPIHVISARAQSTPTSDKSFDINNLQPYFAFMAVVISLVIFILLSGAAWYLVRGINRRRSSRAPPRMLVLPTMLAREAPPTLLATCSALIAQSTLLVTSPVRVGIMPEDLGGKKLLRHSMDFACQGMKRSVSWGKASIGLFGASLPSSTSDGSLSLSSDSILAKLLALQGHYDADFDNLEAGRKRQAFFFGEPLPEVVPTDAAGLFQYTLCLTDAFEDASDPVPFMSAKASQIPADLRTGSVASESKPVFVEQSPEFPEQSAAEVFSTKVVTSEVITSEVVSSTSIATIVLDSSAADVPRIKLTFPSCDHVVSESIQASILAPTDINVLSTEWQPKPSGHRRTRSELTIVTGKRASSRRERRRSMAVFDENMVTTTTTTTTTVRGGRRSRSASMTVTRSKLTRLSSVAEDDVAEQRPVAF